MDYMANANTSGDEEMVRAREGYVKGVREGGLKKGVAKSD